MGAEDRRPSSLDEDANAMVALVREFGAAGWLASVDAGVAVCGSGWALATPRPCRHRTLHRDQLQKETPTALLKLALDARGVGAAAVVTLPYTAALAMTGTSLARCMLSFDVEQAGLEGVPLELNAEQTLIAALGRADVVVLERFATLVTAPLLADIAPRMEEIEHVARVTLGALGHAKKPGVFSSIVNHPEPGDCERCNACPQGHRLGSDGVSADLVAAVSAHLRP